MAPLKANNGADNHSTMKSQWVDQHFVILFWKRREAKITQTFFIVALLNETARQQSPEVLELWQIRQKPSARTFKDTGKYAFTYFFF